MNKYGNSNTDFSRSLDPRSRRHSSAFAVALVARGGSLLSAALRRVVGVIASPLLFWIVIGSGFGTSFRSSGAGGQHYLEFFFPGALIMIVLFTAIFTMMSVIEDRNEGFLLSVLVAPVSRSVIVLGKVLGGATLATLQGLIFLVFAPFVGVHFTLASFGLTVLVIFLVSFSLTGLGFIIAWPMDSTAGVSRHH